MIKEQSETNEFVFNRLKENSELMQFDDEKLRLLLIKMQALQAGLSLMARKEQYSNIFSDENINKYLFDAEPLKDISEADEIIEFYLKPEPRSQHRWIIIRKSDGVKLGTCGYHCLNIEDSSVEIG